MDTGFYIFGFISFAILGNSQSMLQREFTDCENWKCNLRVTCRPANYSAGNSTSLYNNHFIEVSKDCTGLEDDVSVVDCQDGTFSITVANVSQYNRRYNGTWRCFHKQLEEVTVDIPYFGSLDFHQENRTCSSNCFLPNGKISWYDNDAPLVEASDPKVVCEENATFFSAKSTLDDDVYGEHIQCKITLTDANVVIASESASYGEPGGFSTGVIAGIVIGSAVAVGVIVLVGMIIFRVGPFKK